MNVFFTKSARDTIVSLANYLADEIQMPATAERYANKMFEFGNQLSKVATAYTLCKEKSWAKRKLRCATFDKKWVFAYRQNKTNLVIYHIKLGKLIHKTV